MPFFIIYKDVWFLLRELMTAYQPYRKMLAFIIIGSLGGSLLELIFPLCIRKILDGYLPAGDTGAVLLAAGILLGLYMFSYLLNWGVFYWGRSMGASIEYDLRGRLFRHVMDMSFSYFDRARSGQLVSRIVNDIAEIGELMFSIPHLLIVCTATMAGTICLLFYINWLLASVVSALLICKAVEAVRINRRMKAVFMAARQATGEITVRASESIEAVRLVKVFGNEALEIEKLLAAGRDLLRVQKQSFGIMGRMNGSLTFFSNVTNLVIIVLGGLLTAWDMMRLSDLIAFLLYMVIFMKPVFQLTLLTEVYQKGMAGYRRYEELMQEKASPALPCPGEIPRMKGKISFQHVDFSYDGQQEVLRDFSLTINAGEMAAVVGPTGSGKSTLCQLLLGLYEPEKGRILLDDKDIGEWQLSELRGNIGMVQQDVFLFSDSIRNNIAYGRPEASMEEIITAARQARAHDFIAALPEGYEAGTGERGVRLSGGQKQRIAIARIFLRNPPVLVLDEATSGLDNETESQVRQSLADLSAHRTTLVVAHRLASIQHADRIIVLDRGRIVQEGTHDMLLSQQGLYRELYMAQFRENK